MLFIMVLFALSQPINHEPPPLVHAQADSAQISPSRFWGPFQGTSGDVQIDIERSGIAVRVEVPREFVEGLVSGENDTHFIESDIRNDYYYYNLVDQSRHWSYDWRGADSDAPCYKPRHAIFDANAPWCVEIWNYLNGTFFNFTAPKFVRFHDLRTPVIAGKYNFTLFVANRTNSLGYPDFVHAWNKTFVVPVSMSDNPASITGSICDDDDPSNLCPLILAKGVAYATNVETGYVAKAYVNQTTGTFNITGLAPGDYELQASAGVYRGVAFSLSNPMPVLNLQKGETRPVGVIPLKRAPQICGTIRYRNSLSPDQSSFLSRSLTDHPYLPTVGFTVLNITVEARDELGHIYRYQNVSLDGDSDFFRIITGLGVKYTGVDPYGTEFAGLPPVEDGSYQMTVNVYIAGYLQKAAQTVIVASAPGETGPPFPCNQVVPNPVVMESGGVISGTLEFRNLEDLETPHQAELAIFPTATDSLFGGNILVRAFDTTGALRGLVVINGTLPDGRTIYANSARIRFYVIGFSEFYNRTWAGVWGRRDYGLPEDPQGYTLNVTVRGYEQDYTPKVFLPKGANQTVTIRMIRGGALEVEVGSYINRFGTRALQSEHPWLFLNLSIPMRARVYFYDSAGRNLGYVERVMVEGATEGVSGTFFTVRFAGQNWSLREIWFLGYQSTVVRSDTHSIKAYTLGYVQQQDVNVYVELATLAHAFVALLIGNSVDVTAPVFAEPNLFWSIPEHDHATAEATDEVGLLKGAINANLTSGVTTVSMPLFGFGGTVIEGALSGQGHFFYVSADGTRWFDYGLDTATYNIQLPEFGFNKHFMTIQPDVYVTFTDLFGSQTVLLNLFAMARVVNGFTPTSLVAGWVDGFSLNETMPLTWVRVEATNDSFSRAVPTLEGTYTGVGALNLPAGTYNITFSVAFYESQTASAFQVQWNSTYAILPPLGPLCPIGGLPGICDGTPSPPHVGQLVFFVNFKPLIGEEDRELSHAISPPLGGWVRAPTATCLVSSVRRT